MATVINSLRPSDAYMLIKLITNGSDNDMLPGQRQAIIQTSDEISFKGSLETYLSDILNEIHTFSLKKAFLKWRL